MRRCVLALVLFAVSCATAPAPVLPPIWAGLKPGPHAVGFETHTIATPPHRLQVSMWYPARTGGRSLTWRDLQLLTLTERTEQEPSAGQKTTALGEYTQRLSEIGVDAASAQALLDLHLLAREHAAPAAGRFPLLLVAQGNGQSAIHQAVLAEFLASHGYVVATIPSITRLAGPMTADADLRDRVFGEADDLRRAYDAVIAMNSVDRSRVAVLGHSLGARSALLFAMRTPVAAIVSLDGGIGTATGVEIFPRPERRLPPILHLYETADPRIVSDLTFLRGLPSAALRLEKLASMKHLHFTSLGFASTVVPELASATSAGEHLREEVQFVAGRVLSFLDEAFR